MNMMIKSAMEGWYNSAEFDYAIVQESFNKVTYKSEICIPGLNASSYGLSQTLTITADSTSGGEVRFDISLDIGDTAVENMDSMDIQRFYSDSPPPKYSINILRSPNNGKPHLIVTASTCLFAASAIQPMMTFCLKSLFFDEGILSKLNFYCEKYM